MSGKAKITSLFQELSGAVKKPKKKEGHSCGEYIVVTHRKAETTNPNCQRVMLKDVDAYKRSTPVSADEIEIRSLVSRRQAWVVARSKSLTTLTQDQLAYQAQKDEPGGLTTWKAYLWSLAKQAVTLGSGD